MSKWWSVTREEIKNRICFFRPAWSILFLGRWANKHLGQTMLISNCITNSAKYTVWWQVLLFILVSVTLCLLYIFCDLGRVQFCMSEIYLPSLPIYDMDFMELYECFFSSSQIQWSRVQHFLLIFLSLLFTRRTERFIYRIFEHCQFSFEPKLWKDRTLGCRCVQSKELTHS